ncbi:histidine kinase PdhS [Seminavis robusta]|uniref:Histidine kinase PdhS n=1 Tax=Seminavis robusta TaxID=568900 RepID=A0A9N8H587_9STRA|nr:histidine kinase PdhS [Seminavis robusta]|eukprot:Sro68_g038120.1 histidine kinase PdhS (1148) ;mRNA; f:65304-68987
MGIPVYDVKKGKHDGLYLEAIDLLFETSKDAWQVENDDLWVGSLEMDELVGKVQGMLEPKGRDQHGMDCHPSSHSATETQKLDRSALKKLDECFKACKKKVAQEVRREEFRCAEEFILNEQDAGRERRSVARTLEASEEKRLAAEVAQLRGVRLKTQRASLDENLRWKISHAETSYVSRKMVFAKASQVAGAELRLQFARVRTFLEDLHKTRQQVLHREHRRSLNFQTLMHALRGTDPRVVSLDTQISVRLFRQKKADLNEAHMARTLEEAVFLESMMNDLDKIQRCKEDAALDMFDLHVKNLKMERDDNARRQQELELLAASGTLEMAKLVSQDTADDGLDRENDAQIEQRVDAIERKKDFESSTEQSMPTAKLYDTILWSVATDDLGLTTTGSSLYSSDYGSNVMDEDDCEEHNKEVDVVEDEDADGDDHKGEPGQHEKQLTPIGAMHTRRLARELREQEKAMVKKHEKEIRAERRQYQKEGRALKAKHQAKLDEIIESSTAEREELREASDLRMQALLQRQEESIELMKRKDVALMKEALAAEDQRVGAAEERSFRKAQELISAQVFHEVRNALSSIIAMSEMTHSLKSDESITPKELVGSVDDMLEQIGDVVNYSLKMLNETLDITKLNSGAFVPKIQPFDLKDVVARATRMQQPKASRISLSFRPLPKPCIAVSDPNIVERIVATLLSNAVKFTNAGGVEPFIIPLERLESEMSESTWPSSDAAENKSIFSTESTSSIDESEEGADREYDADSKISAESMESDGSDGSDESDRVQLRPSTTKTKFVAVGVADTGPGLSKETLAAAKEALSSSTSIATSHGAQNTGFGLYHAHLQTKALNTQLHLTSLEDCLELMNGPMQDAADNKKAGPGTVIYFKLPVYQGSEGTPTTVESLKMSQEATRVALKLQHKSEYVFRPLPPPNLGRFKVLVADDVIMLRRGVVHTIGKVWGNNFPNCEVSVKTACTAEDMMRAAQAEPFDLIISDHRFNHHVANSVKSVREGKRPCVRFNCEEASHDSTMSNVEHFFEKERFTKEDKDGDLLGLTALTRLARWSILPYPPPVLMLLSADDIKLDPSLGIVIAKKPLRHTDFISSLERSAPDLLLAGTCNPAETPQGDALVNSRGSQLFLDAQGLTRDSSSPQAA